MLGGKLFLKKETAENQLLKLLNLNSSVLLAQLDNISQYSSNRLKSKYTHILAGSILSGIWPEEGSGGGWRGKPWRDWERKDAAGWESKAVAGSGEEGCGRV